MLEREGGLAYQTDAAGVKRRCAWVTANTGACFWFCLHVLAFDVGTTCN
jgi:hypothetical protein